MIISEIKFGLGNQLFQYAAGRSLSHYHSVPLFLNRGYYKIDQRREYHLDCFELPFFDIQNLNQNEDYYYYKEPDHNFDKLFFTAPANVYMNGNWQSEKYFKGIEKIIKKELTLKQQYIIHLDLVAKEIAESNSVCIHIRRGDYAHSLFLYILPTSFYEKAITFLSNKFNNFKTYVFTDDPEWVKLHFLISKQFTLISGDVTCHPLEDFYLMQKCRYHIIGNSSFSWWTAWLCNFPEKIVIAPKKWFSKLDINTTDLIPKHWVKI